MTLKVDMQHLPTLTSWYAASGTHVLPSLFKWCPWVDVDLFYGKVKFGPLCFCMGKVKTMDFSETIVVYDIKFGRCSQLNEYMKLYEYQRSRSFIDLGPDHSDSIFLNFFSSITIYFDISSALRWAIQDQWSSGQRSSSPKPLGKSKLCLKLATNGRSDKGILLTSKVCPQGVFCPCPRYKIIKNVYKIRFRRDHFETCNLWANW